MSSAFAIANKVSLRCDSRGILSVQFMIEQAEHKQVYVEFYVIASAYTMLALRLIVLILLIMVLSVFAQEFRWPYPSGFNVDPFGNSFIGQQNNGIFLLCNGIGCPGRG
ncbi:hypothetical protein NECAME_18384 [Necator americanus]|uniref:Uncharacterized protein n=1 Tax=Necator americanus TaxID=51031 RepID=W2SUS1_NECAM|nr:hypothetical protein NECAME_18384 [Necator americanus]ETN73375.1 hypothetical protein NECAME_18384 [Necator americanus]